jgi:ribosomal protein S12 methylthiotransferase accessory factor
MSNPVSSLSRLFEVVEYLVDDQVGIIRHVQEIPREPGAPDFFRFGAEACNAGAFGQHKNFATAGGVSTDRRTAMAKAIGEAVERYCTAIYDAGELPLTSFEAAPFECAPPNEFALYSHEQYQSPGFPYVPFGKTTPIRWAPVFDATTGETLHAPAAMVFIPYVYDRERGERPIVQPVSTGLACHSGQKEALCSAICEMIERDAFTITWQAQLGMPQIRIETLSDRNRDLVARFHRTGNSVTLFDITMDHGVPAILSVSRSLESEAPALVLAASAHLDPEQAVRKSLEELAHTRGFAQQLKIALPPIVPTTYFENIVTQDDHVHLYCDHANAPLADFLFASTQRIAFGDIENLSTGVPEQDLKILVAQVNAVGHRVLFADLTTPDVGWLGLTVVRAMIPGFHPLFFGHRIRALGGSRLWEVPQKLGCQGVTRESGDNPAPHPFP